MATRTLASSISRSLLLLAALHGCAPDDPFDPGVAPTAEPRSDDDPTLPSELELLRDGLTAVALDPELVALAHARVLVAAKAGEYEVTFADLAQVAADHDIDLSERIHAGVLAQGRSDADAAHALALLDGFVADGLAVTPTLYVPHLDADYFDLEAWEAPVLLSTTRSVEDDVFIARQLDGLELVLDKALLETTPTWFVAYHVVDGEDPAPLRLLARCYCVQTNPQGGTGGTVGVTCQTLGSATTQGSCGRTGLFSGQCNGTCGGAGGG